MSEDLRQLLMKAADQLESLQLRLTDTSACLDQVRQERDNLQTSLVEAQMTIKALSDGVNRRCGEDISALPLVSLDRKLAAAEARLKHADKLAYEIARAILNREHGERSAVSDSLLRYLNVGGIDGPKTVPEWMDKYKAAKAGAGE